MVENGWKLLFEDRDILVVVKEPGMATQTGNFRSKDLVTCLRNYLGEKKEKPEVFLIHRLDQPVGGVLVFAKNKKAAGGLSAQVQNHKVEKYYKAVVEGEIEEKNRLENLLVQDKKAGVAKVVTAGKDAKKAVLDFTRLAVGESPKRSLVEVKLGTGRFHQIRVQLSHHGFPICGDRKYNTLCKPEEVERFPALFAWKLCFDHPTTGKRMEFSEEPSYGYFLEF